MTALEKKYDARFRVVFPAIRELMAPRTKPRRRRSSTETEASTTTLVVTLTADELDPLCAALDSHIYWVLSDESSRDSGYASKTGADDETAGEIEQTDALLRRLAQRGKDEAR